MSIKGDNIMDNFERIKDKVNWGNLLICNYKEHKEHIPSWVWDRQWATMKNYIRMLEDMVEKSEIEIHKLNFYIESFGTRLNNSTPTSPEPVDEIECPWDDDKDDCASILNEASVAGQELYKPAKEEGDK